MIRFLVSRLLLAVPTVVLVTFLIFILVDLSPNDPAAVLAGDNPTPERLAEIRASLGLNEPLLSRYFEWAGAALSGDFGASPITRQPVFDELVARVPVTMSLVLLATLISVVIGVVGGVIAALRPGGILDWLVGFLSNLLLAVPPFVSGILLVLFLAIHRPLLPATGYSPIQDGAGQWFNYAIMPALAMALIPAALIMRQTRGAMIDVLSADYIRTARAKGLRERTTVFKHAAKNAGVPVITVIGLQFLVMMGSSVVVENMFAIPGLGAMSVSAVLAGDLITIQGIVVFFAVLVTLVNLLVDVSYGYFNPKLRTR